jgi:adenylate kinase
MCVEQFGWKQISTGNLCRKHIQEQTEIGKEIDFAIKSGKLISDTLVTQMVADWLREQNGNETLILDGYPRTVAQAEMLEGLIKSKFPSLKITIVRLVISNEEVVARLGTRMICENKACQAVYSSRAASLQAQDNGTCDRCGYPIVQREDDTPQAIIERLKTYYKHEQPLLDLYKSMGYSLPKLDVNRPINMVFEDLKSMVGFDA